VILQKVNSQADAPPHNLVDQYCPVWAKPYAQLARLDRPIGWWLLLLPCWWSACLASIASRQAPNFWHIALFFIGAIAMRGAGCTWNDILDRDLDRQVERTKSRPLACGTLKTWQASIFLSLQCLVGLAVLVQFNAFTIKLGLASIVLVLIYPLMKRITNYPQIVLGAAFAWGGLMGWAALFGSLELAPILLYFAAILWTIGYDTIYALQDLEDDSLIGIGSTARAYGKNVPKFVGFCYLGAIWLVFAAIITSYSVGWFTMLGLLAFAIHLAWQIRGIKIDEPHLALKLFKSNRVAGLLLFAGFFVQAIRV
jgi:4-hydroxybenzoate polyprenyltransferase